MTLKIVRYLWNNLTCLLIWLIWRSLFRVKVIGRENLPEVFRRQQQNILVVANHQSLFDSYLAAFFCWPWSLLYPTLIPWHALAKKHYPQFWLFRKACQLWQCIPVDRTKLVQRELVRLLPKCLTEGTLMVFPEGGINADHPQEMGKWKLGTIHLAIENQALVIPLAIQGMYRVFPLRKKSPRLYWLPRFFRKIVVVIGKPLKLAALTREEATERIHTALQEALDEASNILRG